MIIDSLRNLAGLFSRRFFFNALLPTMITTSFIMAVIGACLTSLLRISAWWTGLDAISKLAVVAIYLAIVWFLAAAVASQWRSIIQLYEGYPLQMIFSAFDRQAPGVRWHQQHLEKLGSGDDLMKSYNRYPLEENQDRVLPTTFGNILLSAERYPEERYGIDPILFWTRLYPFLPERFQRDYEEFVKDYEFPIIVSFQAAVAGMITAGATLLTHQHPFFFLACLLGCSAVSYGAYALSLQSAEELAEQQRTAFDLYRDRLLEAWPTPPDIDDEREAFTFIQRFVVMGGPSLWKKPQKAHHKRFVKRMRDRSLEDRA